MTSNVRQILGAVAAATLATTLLGACGGESASTDDANCTPKHESVKTVKDGELTIGVIDIPPFSSYNGGTPEGIDVSIVNKIAMDECLEPVYQQATYADAVQSISGGNIDLAVGTIDATAKRMKAVDFSASTYLDGMGIASKSGASSVKELESVGTVGTIDGYLWVDDLKKILGDNLKTYPSSVELKADFDAGRVEAAVDAYGVQVPQFKDDSEVEVFLANETPDDRVQAIVKAPEAAFPMTKGNSGLQKALSDGIEEQRNAGTVDDLLKKAGLSESLGKVGATQYVVP